jgi:hypothetical protein
LKQAHDDLWVAQSAPVRLKIVLLQIADKPHHIADLLFGELIFKRRHSVFPIGDLALNG